MGIGRSLRFANHSLYGRTLAGYYPFMRKSRRIIVAVMTNGAYGREIAEGVLEYARELGGWEYYFEGASNHPEVIESIRVAITRWKAEGIVGQLADPELQRVVHHSGIPAVNVSTLVPVDMPGVFPDSGLIGSLAARYFLDRGFRNFAFVGRPRSLDSEARGATFRAEIERAGLRAVGVPHEGARIGNWMELYECMANDLARIPRPAAVFAVDDIMGRDVLRAADEHRWRVPEELAVLGAVNDVTVCSFCKPPLSSVILPLRQIGQRAAQLLDEQLNGKTLRARTIRLPPLGVATRQSSDILAVSSPMLAAALRFIHTHAADPIAVSDLVAQVPTGRRTLERLFREELGRTPREEIERVHVERAKQLLAQTDTKLETVVVAAGFRDYAQFLRAFRTRTGLAPSDYRDREQREGRASGSPSA